MMDLQDDSIDIPLTMQDFNQALLNCNKSVSENTLLKYENWTNEFGST